MIDVSVIIVNYNTIKLTSDCINSVFEKTKGVTYEVILVDNASTDGSKEVFEKDKRIKYIYSQKNGGFGYGNNLGIKTAQGKYLFLLNSDTILLNNAIALFYQYAESHSPNCIYGCYLDDGTGNYATSYVNFPRTNILNFLKSFFVKDDDIPEKEIKSVPVIVGADLFVSRKIFNNAGGFNENIFFGGEECELQYRMMKLGISRSLIPSPQIVHYGGRSTKGEKSAESHARGLKTHFTTIKLMLSPANYILARIYYTIRLLFGVIIKPNRVNWLLFRTSFCSVHISK